MGPPYPSQEVVLYNVVLYKEVGHHSHAGHVLQLRRECPVQCSRGARVDFVARVVPDTPRVLQETLAGPAGTTRLTHHTHRVGEEPADATPVELPVGVACEKGSESIFLLVIMIVIMIFVVLVVMMVILVVIVVLVVVGVEEVGMGPQFTSFLVVIVIVVVVVVVVGVACVVVVFLSAYPTKFNSCPIKFSHQVGEAGVAPLDVDLVDVVARAGIVQDVRAISAPHLVDEPLTETRRRTVSFILIR